MDSWESEQQIDPSYEWGHIQWYGGKKSRPAPTCSAKACSYCNYTEFNHTTLHGITSVFSLALLQCLLLRGCSAQTKRNAVLENLREWQYNAPVTEPILPPYENCSEFYGINNNVSSATYNFSLVPTKDSTLPPLINAMEVFFVGPVLTNGTNNTDGM